MEKLQLWLRNIGKYHTLQELKDLQTLSLNNNNLETIPPEIFQLKKLKCLLLYNNNLREIPREIGQLKNLEELSLHNNNIKKLPREIGKLGKLRYLSIRNNNLQEFPLEIARLKNVSIHIYPHFEHFYNYSNKSKCILENIYEPISELL